MSLVTLSYAAGTAGPALGGAVARRLGYRLVDRESLEATAHGRGLDDERFTHLGEEKPSLWERFDIETRRYLALLDSVVYGFAEADDAVLLGRGAQWLLRGLPHVLRVRLVAPFEARVARLTAALSSQADERVDPREAGHMIRRSDAEKAGRMRYLYGVDLTDPLLYDLTINDAHLDADAAAGLIVATVRRPELATTDTARRRLADRALGARVALALLSDPRTRARRVRVEVEDGVAWLDATHDRPAAIEIAGAVSGVREVRAESLATPLVGFPA
jgi:cytidylate kinase